MTQAIRFFRKNYVDVDEPTTVTASLDVGSGGVNIATLSRLRDRSNDTSWSTETLSSTVRLDIDIDLKNERDATFFMISGVSSSVTKIELFYSNSSFTTNVLIDDTDVIGVTETVFFDFDQTLLESKQYYRVRLHAPDSSIINASQIVISESLGQLEGFPVISPQLNRNIIKNTMLSGKRRSIASVGGVDISLTVNVYKVQNDLLLLESLFLTDQSFMVWLGGGDEAQFATPLTTYRKRDIYLVKTTNNLRPVKSNGVYSMGYQQFKIDLSESVD